MLCIIGATDRTGRCIGRDDFGSLGVNTHERVVHVKDLFGFYHDRTVLQLESKSDALKLFALRVAQ